MATIEAARASAADTEAAVAAVSGARKIQVNTLQNYTRWPIALLRDLGWATRGPARFGDGRKYGTFHLTDKGQALADRVVRSVDLRVDDAAQLAPEERKALAAVAHFRMLERSGFDVAPVGERIAEAEALAAPVFERLGTDGRNLLFSPFQSLSLEDIAAAFPAHGQTARVEEGASRTAVAAAPDGRDDRSHLFVHPNMVTAEGLARAAPTYFGRNWPNFWQSTVRSTSRLRPSRKTTQGTRKPRSIRWSRTYFKSSASRATILALA
ncbi:hypothetical protein [Sinorhizobium psoraleae]|uniref:Uncharacterized protein n=1 Tax=Sinorhizobium psoraleae TaxID=520838 RepID=A0ABT4KA12_9HYPH|nr:hypothetical protein [Sinorhizobium psoraleae]MCZ4088757.1 hypothetical protein [Sinorhizobium psoraleae]